MERRLFVDSIINDTEVFDEDDAVGAIGGEQQVLDIAQFQNHPTEFYCEVYLLLVRYNWLWKMVLVSLLGVSTQRQQSNGGNQLKDLRAYNGV